MTLPFDDLVSRAAAVMENAWAPYSRFRVGAALLARDGRVFTGCNVENASFGLTICAERSAVFKAVSEKATEFAALALICDGARAVAPCGACLQVLREFAEDLPIVLADLKGARNLTSLKELLPGAFSAADLGA